MLKILKSPKEFIVDVFKEKDIVFLSEDHAVKDNLLFVKELIPHLYQAGVAYLGMEFGASEDQEKLDKLITGDVYDADEARDIMFSYNVIFPYQEYLDLYEAVFNFNQSLAKNQNKFRILNLSYRFDWSKFKKPYTEENKALVFTKGDIEAYRTNIIKQQVLDTGKKILILTGTIHAFTKFRFEGSKNQYFGQRVYDLAPNKTYNIQLHEYTRNDQGQRISPCKEEVEAYFKEFASPVGMDLSNSQIGDLPFELYQHKPVLLKELFDGYIYLKPLKDRQGCIVDKGFLNGKTLQDIQQNFPDPNWHKIPKSFEDYWQLVYDYVDLDKR